MDVVAMPVVAILTFISFARRFPPSGNSIAVAALCLAYLNIAGRVLPWSPSMYALFILGLAVDPIVPGTHPVGVSGHHEHSGPYLQGLGTAAWLVLLVLVPIGIGYLLHRLRRRNHAAAAP